MSPQPGHHIEVTVVPVAVPATAQPAVFQALAVDAVHSFSTAAIAKAAPSTGQVIAHDAQLGAAVCAPRA